MAFYKKMLHNYMAIEYLEIVKPHIKISREITQEDLASPEFGLLCANMIALCRKGNGVYEGFFAVAHPQVNNTDPLRFFIIGDKYKHKFEDQIIANPVITRHTKTTVKSYEGCLSFSNYPMTEAQRYNKTEVDYTPVILDKEGKAIFSNKKHVNLSSKEAKIFQHEIDHLDAKYIYPLEIEKEEVDTNASKN